ncbi:MAG: DMT family transporter [Firmicutes bacterium]|nr:DMT family transporter [Bacillota bacterium]
MYKQLKADLALLFVAVGWGASFILTKTSLTELATYNFLATRFIIAFLLSSAIFIKEMLKIDKKTFKNGNILGIILFLSFALQTVGLNYTSASKSAFITGFNVVLVPIMAALMIKSIPKKKTIFSVFLAFIGLGVLTLNGSITGINIGDLYTLISSIFFALYIIYVGKFTHESKSVPLAVLQMGVVGFLSLITSFVFEKTVLPTQSNVWISILILSVLCTSGAYIIQSVAQRYTTPSHTALIYTAEPVFAAIFGYVLSGEVLTTKGKVGAILILSGMIITELDFTKIFIKQKRVAKVKE